MCNANIICSFCWYLGGYIYTNRAWLFAMPYYIFDLRGAVVPARLCRLPEQELHQQNYWHYCLVGALETSAPPEIT